MIKKAIIFDLDNTIYPVSSVGAHFFEPLFQLLANSGENLDLDVIREQAQRKPFTYIAEIHNMSPQLRAQGMTVLKELTVDTPIQPYAGYEQVKALALHKFLVTAGFTNMQFSKIQKLGIEADFEGIYIIDPLLDNTTKKSTFAKIMADNSFEPQEILIIGDDYHSEIQAAKELGMDAILYDSLGIFGEVTDVPRITSLLSLPGMLQ